MAGVREGACAEPGPRGAHCTEHRYHGLSCYDASEDVSWNEGQWYAFDLAPHDCKDTECPDKGYRGPPGRESEYSDVLTGQVPVSGNEPEDADDEQEPAPE